MTWSDGDALTPTNLNNNSLGSETVRVTGDSSDRSTKATAVQNAINTASSNGDSFVFVPHDFLNYDASSVTFDNSIRMLREGQIHEGYDALAYGADPTGANNARPVFAETETLGQTIIPPGTFLVDTSNFTFNNPVLVESGGQFDVASGIRLSFQDHLNAPPNEEIFTGSGTIGNFSDQTFPFYDWFGASITNDSGIPGRPYVSTGTVSLTVGTDTSTIQEALDQIPLLLRHKFAVSIPDGTYVEDLVVPVHYRWRGNATDGPTQGLQITGNATTPANVVVDSIWFPGGNTYRVPLEGIKFVADGPHADAGATVEVRRGVEISCKNLILASADAASSAFRAYGGQIEIKEGVDIGTDVYSSGFTAKVGGKILVANNDNAGNPNSGQVTGNLFNSQNGEIHVTHEPGTYTFAGFDVGGGNLSGIGPVFLHTAGETTTFVGKMRGDDEGAVETIQGAASWLFSNPVRLGSVNRETLSGKKSLSPSSAQIQSLDPDGSNRNVDVQDAASAETVNYWIGNRGSTDNLVVRDQNNTTLLTLTPGDVGRVVGDGTGWIAFKVAGTVS